MTKSPQTFSTTILVTNNGIGKADVELQQKLIGIFLNYYHLAEKVQVGIVGGMADILEAQWQADKVITL